MKYITTILAALAIGAGSLKADEDIYDYIREKREKLESEYRQQEIENRLRELEEQRDAERRERYLDASFKRSQGLE